MYPVRWNDTCEYQKRSHIMRLSEGSKERAAVKSNKERLIKSLSEKDFYDVTDEDSNNEIEKVDGLEGVERK